MMFNSAFLDVAIGLVFLFCLISLAASTMRETVEAILKTRAIMLEYGIRELVGDATRPVIRTSTPAPAPAGVWAKMQAAAGLFRGKVDIRLAGAAQALEQSVAKALYDHPQINGLFSGEYPARLKPFFGGRSGMRVAFFSRLPSYIPSRNFSVALLDFVARGPVQQADATRDSLDAVDLSAIDVAAIRRGISAVPNARLQRALLNVLDEAGDDLERARQGVERWYDTAMDRVSGWYRRETQFVLFIIGFTLAAVLNLDAVAIGQRLLVDDHWRNALVASAVAENCTSHKEAPGCHVDAPPQGSAAAPSGTLEVKDVGALETALAKYGFIFNAPRRSDWPVQYWPSNIWPYCGADKCVSTKLGGILLGLPGYFIMAFAASLGAPFWFDLLNKLIVIRSTVKPHEKSGEDKSKENAADSDDDGKADDAGGAGIARLPSAGGGKIAQGGAQKQDDDAERDEIALLDPYERPREADDARESAP